MQSEKQASLKGLAAIAAGRDHLTTAEFAHAVCKSPQTIRKNYCLKGDCFGVRPIKVGNNLLWPVVDMERLLTGEPSGTRIMPAAGTAANCAESVARTALKDVRRDR